MKRLIALILCLVMVFCSAIAEEYTLRKGTKFGMDRREVKKAESGKPVQDDKAFLVYEKEIDGKDAQIAYIFDEYDELSQLMIRFTKEYKKKDYGKYLDDFRDIDDSIIEKYGEPTYQEAFFYATEKKVEINSFEELIDGIKKGTISIFFSRWQKDNIFIRHEILKMGDDLWHSLSYQPQVPNLDDF